MSSTEQTTKMIELQHPNGVSNRVTVNSSIKKINIPFYAGGEPYAEIQYQFSGRHNLDGLEIWTSEKFPITQ